MLGSINANQDALRRFVADASHELRAPITSIRGNADVLVLGSDLPVDERVEMARDIRDEAAWLGKLIDGLLALALGDAGLHFHPQLVALHDLVHAVCRSWTGRPGPTLHMGDGEAAVIVADPLRIEQLITILLDNAMKYTPAHGSVFCRVHVDSRFAVVSVADTGVGIDPSDMPHIFERFYRAAPGGRSEHAGAGIGLAIARQIVDEAGATIDVESTPGHGTTFIVRFLLQMPLDHQSS